MKPTTTTIYITIVCSLFFLFYFQTTSGIYASQYVKIDCSVENLKLDQSAKENIWYSYVKLTDGNWIHYSFIDTVGNRKVITHNNCKKLCKELNDYLVSKGVLEERITMKYSPFASLVVYKESGKNIQANHVTRDAVNAQHFTIHNESGGVCMTKAGNKIDFPANAFPCALETQVTIEIHEILSKKDFVRTGYTATSNGKMLESRGMYYINASHNGKDINLRKGKSVVISFSENNFPAANEASLFNTFYGTENKGIVNWNISSSEKATRGSLKAVTPIARIEPTTTYVIADDYSDYEYGELTGEFIIRDYSSATEEDKRNFPVYLRISKLGNINCDRFNGGSKKTDVIVQLDNYDYDQIRVYAIFNNIKSVINGYYRKEHKGMIKFDGLPKGDIVTYLAATFKGSEVKLAYLTDEIKENDHIKLSLKTYTRKDYERILDDLIPN